MLLGMARLEPMGEGTRIEEIISMLQNRPERVPRKIVSEEQLLQELYEEAQAMAELMVLEEVYRKRACYARTVEENLDQPYQLKHQPR